MPRQRQIRFVNNIRVWRSKRWDVIKCESPDRRVLEEFPVSDPDAWEKAVDWASKQRDFVQPPGHQKGKPKPKPRRPPSPRPQREAYKLPKGLKFALMSMTVDDSTARLPRGMKPTPHMVDRLDTCFKILGAKKMKYSYVFPRHLDARVIVQRTIETDMATPPPRRQKSEG